MAESEKIKGEYNNTSQQPSFMSTYDIVMYIVKNMSSFIVAIVLGIVIFWHLQTSMQYANSELWKKICYSLIPLLFTYIYQWIVNAPKPKKYYFMSILTREKAKNVGFSHRVSGGKWLFTASTPIEIDGKEYLFLGGGMGQDDTLLLYDNKTKNFINVIGGTRLNDKNSSTYSAVSMDMDGDGKNDLIVGRTGKVTLYKNLGNMKFEPHVIHLPKDREPLALAISDYNKDGRPDIYISYFTPLSKYRGTVFNDPKHNRDNVLLQNIGTNKNPFKFMDVTAKTLTQGTSNTFTSAWVDLDNDTFPDLVLSNDSGDVEILKNLQGKKFESIRAYNRKGNWMGIGVGDIDNDGDQDLFLTNIGENTERNKLSLGDVKKNQKQVFHHVLLRNDGKFKFTEISKSAGIQGDGFGWGAIMEDLNNDGRMDILFAENFMLNPKNWLYPGVGHYYSGTSTSSASTPNETSASTPNKFKRIFQFQNPKFGQTPMLADINQDGIKDVIWVNMSGPSTYYLRQKPKGNYLNVVLPETADYVNAQVVLQSGQRKFYKQVIQGGVGFGGDQSNVITFGLGDRNKIKQVRVYTLSGKTHTINNPKINTTFVLKPTN